MIEVLPPARWAQLVSRLNPRAWDANLRGPARSLHRGKFTAVMSAIPASSRWIFWDVDPDAIELERDANGVLARVLERGCLADVTWLIQTYGLDRIHGFFRDVWAPEVSARTRSFWRAFFEAENETWATPPAFRRNSSSLWNG